MLEKKKENEQVQRFRNTLSDALNSNNSNNSDNTFKLEADKNQDVVTLCETINYNTISHNRNDGAYYETNNSSNEKYLKRQKSPFVLKGKDETKGETHELYYGENKIGRFPNNDILIDNPCISRLHATITVHKDKVEVKDHSLNGTYINVERIEQPSVVTLKLNDEIQIWLFTYVLEQRAEDKDTYRIEIEKIGDEMAYVQSNHSRRLNAGFSLIELLIVVTIIGIIAAISIPNLLSTRRAANSASAVATMRLISTSQASYQAGVGNGEYATVDNLVREQYIDSSVGAASLPSSSTTQIPKSGYVFFFNTIASDPTTNTLAGYSVSARPLVNGLNGSIISGNKSFFVDNSGVIKVSPSPLAPYADANSAALN